MPTFAVSLHFSAGSSERLNLIISRLADATGNDFRIKEQIPIHLTLGMFHADDEKSLLLSFGKFTKSLSDMQLQAGWKLTEVLFVNAEIIKNKAVFLMADAQSSERLCRWNKLLHDEFLAGFKYANNGFYLPEYFLAHVALATGLSPSQADSARHALSEIECPVHAEVSSVVLSQCKPYRKLEIIEC
ncbi:MAG: hypothetical protein K6G00_05960 [Treponema sp.]|nr:hypothetical protein [Treponema sp.]